MITVAIVEDNPDIREGLKKFLRSREAFICSIVAGSAEAFFEQLDPEHPPQVVLMDIGLPGMSGLDGIKLLKERAPETLIIMLSVFDDAERIFQALCNGATGYLLKGTPLPQIQDSILSVVDGGSPMSPQIARKVVEFFNRRQDLKTTVAKPGESQLSTREKEVVEGLVDGLSYKMIADRMDISIDTVRGYIKRIYGKLQVNSKIEVVSKSLRGEI